MPIRRWSCLLATAFAFAQEGQPFVQEAAQPWKPAWELTLRGDDLVEPEDPPEGFRRASVQLRLRWTWELGALRLEAGTRSALGSDGNRFNGPRWDQQPSNGSQLDLARAEASWTSPRSFGSFSLGFQENGLLVSQALWDRDLRFLGAGGRAGFRSAGGRLQEAGLRVALGRVRNLLGGRLDLAAAQAVLKLDTGPWSWTAHGGLWDLSWDAGRQRLRTLPGGLPGLRQKLSLEAAGASSTWHSRFPLEARWFGARNRDTRDGSEELQILAGGRERPYWPQLSFTWQRLSATGTLYPLNGDEWWFYRSARGPRFELVLPLPGQWSLSLVHLRQKLDGSGYRAQRTLLTLVKGF